MRFSTSTSSLRSGKSVCSRSSSYLIPPRRILLPRDPRSLGCQSSIKLGVTSYISLGLGDLFGVWFCHHIQALRASLPTHSPFVISVSLTLLSVHCVGGAQPRPEPQTNSAASWAAPHGQLTLDLSCSKAPSPVFSTWLMPFAQMKRLWGCP